jgi:hypothetical protein
VAERDDEPVRLQGAGAGVLPVRGLSHQQPWHRLRQAPGREKVLSLRRPLIQVARCTGQVFVYMKILFSIARDLVKSTNFYVSKLTSVDCSLKHVFKMCIRGTYIKSLTGQTRANLIIILHLKSMIVAPQFSEQMRYGPIQCYYLVNRVKNQFSRLFNTTNLKSPLK